MKRRKSKPEHDALVNDEAAHPVDRASAIYALALDGHRQFEAAFARLTLHEEGVLRGRAIHALLMWGRPDLLELAEQTLVADPDTFARSYVMLGLTRYVTQRPHDRERVLRALARSVHEDAEEQRCAYQAFLEVLEPRTHGHILNFDPDRDVDWGLVNRYYTPDDSDHRVH